MLQLIGRKIGMTQIFGEDGLIVPVTVVELLPNIVVQKRSVDVEGYNAIVLASGEVDSQKLSRPVRGQFESRSLPAMRIMHESRFAEDIDKEIGSEITIKDTQNWDYVDVIGYTKGRGFQGVMKRHNFSGGRKTHGSKFHRANGSTGMAATPSKVIKGTKMPGRMTKKRHSIQNLRVIRVDLEKRVLLLKGSVPGVRGSKVLLQKSIKY